jgi:hypothetical protein
LKRNDYICAHLTFCFIIMHQQNNMKYKLIPTIFLMACTVLVSAQITVTCTPSTVRSNVPFDTLEVIGHIVVKNTATTAKTFQWVRTVNNQTQGWTNAVCDRNLCYLPNVGSQSFTLDPNQEGILDVHVAPNRIVGMASIDIKVTETGNNTNTVTARYLFNQVSGIREVDRAAIKIYPNPAKEYFIISDNDYVSIVNIYNIVGRLVKTVHVANGLRIDVSDMADGIYLVRMQTIGGVTVKTVKLNKQSNKA